MTEALPRWVYLLAAGALGAMLMTTVPSALEAIGSPDAPMLWWLARASGLVGYLALFFTMLFGVFVSARGAGGLLHSATAVDLHKGWALAALLATAVHVLAVVANTHAGVGATAALVPFASSRLRGPVALGSLAMWGLILVGLSSVLAKRHSPTTWRAIHATAFGTFLLSLVHAATAGTDTTSPLVRIGYAATIVTLVGAIIQRILLARAAGRGRASGPPGRKENG